MHFHITLPLRFVEEVIDLLADYRAESVFHFPAVAGFDRELHAHVPSVDGAEAEEAAVAKVQQLFEEEEARRVTYPPRRFQVF